MPTLWSKHPVYAIGVVAGVVCSLVILASAFQLARWHVVTRGASVQAGNIGFDAKWIQLRGLVPASITVFVPTWLPPDFRGISPSYTTGGGGSAWTYSVAYTNDRLSGDRPYLIFTEEAPTPPCPSPPCGQSSRGIMQPLPLAVGRQLPHATVLISHQAPELVLRWRVGAYIYSIEAHQESRGDVLHVATTFYQFHIGGHQQQRVTWSTAPARSPGRTPSL